jgi:hypothetical protein
MWLWFIICDGLEQASYGYGKPLISVFDLQKLSWSSVSMWFLLEITIPKEFTLQPEPHRCSKLRWFQDFIWANTSLGVYLAFTNSPVVRCVAYFFVSIFSIVSNNCSQSLVPNANTDGSLDTLVSLWFIFIMGHGQSWFPAKKTFLAGERR